MWQELQEELHEAGLTVVTVALDIDPDKARPWIEAAPAPDGAPAPIALIDSSHSVNELLGINNVPMAVWIDEDGRLVRPAENARIKESDYRKVEITPELPERRRIALTELQKMPDTGNEYRAAIVDWAGSGAESRFALPADEVITRSQPRPRAHAEAAACFELGQHLYRTTGDKEVAVPWWKKAHALDRGNWTYKRQAWTLESTPEGEASDLSQDVGDTYGTSWLDDLLATGGADNYLTPPRL